MSRKFSYSPYKENTPESRRKKHRKKFLIWVFILVGIGALFVGILYVVFRTEVFQVQAFEVTGTKTIAPIAIRLALEKSFQENTFQNLFDTKNILFWSFGKSNPDASKVLADLSSVSLKTDLWSRKVVVDVEERELEGIWCVPSGSCFNFDNNGILFSKAPQTFGNLILKIEDENTREPALGTPALPEKKWFSNLFDTLALLKEASIQFTKIHIRQFGLREWSVETRNGPEIYFSFPFVPVNMANVLKEFEKRTSLKTLSYIDFRIPGRMYYK